MRQAFLDKGRDLEVYSAGLGALVGHPADEKVRLLMAGRGIDVSEHRAVQVNRDMLRWAELILVMEDGHRAELRNMDPSVAGKVMLLGRWIDTQVADPYMQEMAAFEDALDVIDRAVASWMERL